MGEILQIARTLPQNLTLGDVLSSFMTQNIVSLVIKSSPHDVIFLSGSNKGWIITRITITVVLGFGVFFVKFLRGVVMLGIQARC